MTEEIALRPSYWASVSGGKDSLYMLNLILHNLDRYPLDGGTVFSYYLCETCNKISSEMHYGDEYGFGDFRDEALERENAHVCDSESEDR